MKMYEIVIEVDTNDADYITSVSKVTALALKELLELFAKVKAFEPYETRVDGRSWTHRHNFPDGECLRTDLGERNTQELYGLTPEDLDFLLDILPYAERGFHTITSVAYGPWVERTKVI